MGADGFWDFWLSPIGELHQSFNAQKVLRELPQPGTLPAWVDEDSIFEIIPHQVQRDIEQFEYLVSSRVLNTELHNYVVDLVLPEFRRMLGIAQLVVDNRSDVYFLTHPQRDLALFFALQKKALHIHAGESVVGDAINSKLDLAQAQNEYLQKDHRIIVIDDFFSQDALRQLREYLLESTIWTEAKFGHVGAYLENGFACPLVAQIDRELRSKLPRVFGDLTLESAWAYMYDGSLGGISTHADNAQVQINFWITPTDANLASENCEEPSGGLVVYGIGPPEDWGPDQYNNVYAKGEIEEMLATIGHRNVTIPYVQNRALLFDSTYFHRTDCMKFKKGYENRRINVTFLYGKRKLLERRPPAKLNAMSSLSSLHASDDARTIRENMEHFYTRGENMLDEDGWAMLRDMNM